MIKVMSTNMGPVVVIWHSVFNGERCAVGVTRYYNATGGPGRVALLAVLDDGEVYGKISVNLHNAPMAPEEFALDEPWDDYERAALIACGAGITDTGRTARSGFVDFRILRLAEVPPLAQDVIAGKA